MRLLGILAAVAMAAACSSRNLQYSNGDLGGRDGSARDGAVHDLGGHDLAGADGGTGGACQSDSDCVWRASGCCSVCSNRTDPVPPPIGCGIACPGDPGGCLCVGGHCQAGTLEENDSCDPNHDACGPNLKCCNTCCGVPPAFDLGLDPDPRCVMPDYTPQGPICPPVA